MASPFLPKPVLSGLEHKNALFVARFVRIEYKKFIMPMICRNILMATLVFFGYSVYSLFFGDGFELSDKHGVFVRISWNVGGEGQNQNELCFQKKKFRREGGGAFIRISHSSISIETF